MEEAKNPGLFTAQQIQAIRDIEADYGESIWADQVRSFFTF